MPAGIALGKGATLGGNGMIASFAAAAGSTVSPGDSIGTLHVVDSAAFGPGSTYEAQLGAPGTSDLIAIDGQAFLAGHLLALPAAGFEPVLGASYTVLTAEGGITARFSPDTSFGPAFGNIAATYPFLAPALSYSADAVDLTIARSDIPFAAAGETPNEFAAGGGADGLALTSPVATALLPLNQTSAATAFDSLSGEIYASAQSLMQQQSASLREATNARLRQAFDGGAPDATSAPLAAAALPADPALGLHPTLWTEGFGGWDHFLGNSNAASLDGTAAGFLLGLDNPIGRNWRAGIAGGYSGSSFDVHSRASSGSRLRNQRGHRRPQRVHCRIARPRGSTHVRTALQPQGVARDDTRLHPVFFFILHTRYSRFVGIRNRHFQIFELLGGVVGVFTQRIIAHNP